MVASEALQRERRLALGRRLREIRQQCGLTQERLALKAKVDRSFYVDFENGHHTIKLEKLYQITDALDIEMVDLFNDTPVYDLPR